MSKSFTKQKSGSTTANDKCFTLKNYIQEYVNSYVNISETELAVNDQMAAYEEREIKRLKDTEALRGVEDEDGFVTVISTKARTANLDSEIVSTAAQGYFFDPYARLRSALTPRDTKSGISAATRPLDNFYRFQVRQKQSDQVEELKRKFEEDKRRIAELKRNKIFSNEVV